ncbi:hypothetical protein KUTeg_010178 [Tegillarca granosa]|uniref:Mitochondrial intermembrane space import and assembly protein 40 n=1 Tax=Tegillarca granosa TaxID=220873 RepID=A0ABQ9F937_TEGGR|nr:hypothetical protein KUTeg_010178 [Tegillarca granosa]
MAYCKEEGNGKDRVIFATKEDLESPSKSVIVVSEEDEDQGAILPNGEINWDCPCLGDYPYGPCGEKFREMFTCNFYSTEEPKGSECSEQNMEFFTCLFNHSKLYGLDENNSQSEDLGESQSEDLINSQSNSTSVNQSEDTDSALNKNSTEMKS